MDNAAQKLLESATHRTLHASNFSRSSSQASLVLSDLLSRYLALLSSTCAKYAQHAGRTKLTPMDALSALDELGVSLDELKEYGSTEGIELNRYAVKSLRRVEDLNEFRGVSWTCATICRVDGSQPNSMMDYGRIATMRSHCTMRRSLALKNWKKRNMKTRK